jgi:hypothetical protein
MPTNQELIEVYNKKSDLRRKLFTANEKVLETSSLLKTRKAYIISSTEKKKLGTNDKERDAYILEHTRDIFDELGEFESEKRSLDLEYSLVCDKIECIQWQIRNEQVEAINSGREEMDYITGDQVRNAFKFAFEKKASKEPIVEAYGCSLKEYNQAEE